MAGLQKDPDLKAITREGMPTELWRLNSSKCQRAPRLRAARGPQTCHLPSGPGGRKLGKDGQPKGCQPEEVVADSPGFGGSLRELRALGGRRHTGVASHQTSAVRSFGLHIPTSAPGQPPVSA